MEAEAEAKPGRTPARRLLIGFLIVFSIIEAAGFVLFIVRMASKG